MTPGRGFWIAVTVSVLLAACAPATAPSPPTAPPEAAPPPAAPAGAQTTQPPAAPATAQSTGPWTFTDDRGVTVLLPERPKRIVACSTAAAPLWDLGVQVVGVFGPTRRADGSKEPLIGDVDLGAVQAVEAEYCGGDLDLEKLASLRPDLIVQPYWPPQPFFGSQELAARVEAIAPTVAILGSQRPINWPITRFAELAEASGADLNAPEVTAARQRFERANQDLKAAIGEKPGLKVLFVFGNLQQLYVANPPTWSDLRHFQELGLDIVVPGAPDGLWEAISWEQALKYPADVIVYDARTHATPPAQLAEKIPTWNQHPAVRAGQIAAWQAEPRWSHQGFAPVLEELAQTVRKSRSDVVP